MMTLRVLKEENFGLRSVTTEAKLLLFTDHYSFSVLIFSSQIGKAMARLEVEKAKVQESAEVLPDVVTIAKPI